VLVFCSCRTRAEIEGFRQSAGVFHPFITEHGGAAFVPTRYFGSDLHNARAVAGYQAIEFGLAYDSVAATVRRTADEYHLAISAFAEMSIEQAARECGLPLLDARLAKLREYSERFRLLTPDAAAERRLVRALASSGIWCTRCGDFLHAASVPGPASAAAGLTTLYRTTFGAVVTAAVGGEALADVRRQVDVDLETMPRPNESGRAETLEWIEAIVDRIRALRAGAASPGTFTTTRLEA
jgi:mannosyl-3-phosphoglycerate phosphatase